MMLSGFYSAASGVLLQQRTLNVLGNNIANVNTPGYRVERVVSTTFEDELMTRLQGNATGQIGSATPLRVVEEVASLHEAGALYETGRSFDVALNGSGFYNIRGEDGELYLTRNGNFDMDENGYLVLSGVGNPLGASGNLIRVKNADFTVDENGMVYDNKGKYLDTILITEPTAEAGLKKTVNGVYTVEDETQNQPTGGQYYLYQGVLERSNIDLNREYTMVMEASRAFQACSTALKIVDELNQKTATQIASI